MLIYLIKKNDSSLTFWPADDIEPWMIWGYYISPMMYGQNAIVMNEFLDKRWSAVRYLHSLIVFICEFQICIHFPYLHMQIEAQIMHFQHHKPSWKFNKIYPLQPNIDPRYNAPTVGTVLLKSRGFYTEDYWFWICIGALFGFSLLFNVLFIAALTYLNRKWSYLIPTQSFFYRDMKFQSWQILVWKMNFSSGWFKSRHCGWWKWQEETFILQTTWNRRFFFDLSPSIFMIS